MRLSSRKAKWILGLVATLLLVQVSIFNGNAQCVLIGPSGTTITPCIGNSSTSSVNTGQYSLLNVIQGFQYQISTNCTAFNSEITLYDNTNTQIGFNNSTVCGGFTQGLVNYTATYTGQIKVNVTEKPCLPSGKAVNLSVTVTLANNTLDNQLAEGMGTGWIGHVYQEPGMDLAPGPPSTVVFANYDGYFNQPGTGIANLAFNQTFGPTASAPYCFPILSSGIPSVSQNVDNMSVRFRNQNTLDGIYQLYVGGDDGARLYTDTPNPLTTPATAGTTGPVLASGINLWSDHGFQVQNQFFALNGSNNGLGTGLNHFVFDFYQHHGGITAGFGLLGVDNTLSTPNSTVCSGSSLYISGTDVLAVYANALFQWQVATSPSGTFSNVTTGSGGNSETFTPNLQNLTATPQTYYFRRQAVANGITHYSPYITWTVSPETTTLYNVTGGGAYCAGSSGAIINLSGSQTGITYALQLNTPGGLYGEYFAGTTPGGTPSFTRVDPTINFTVGGPWPGGSLGSSNFSSRWTGQLLAPTTGSYTISTNSDDGVRVWVNGVLIIDDFTNHAPTTDNASISLVAGTFYDIKMEYFQGGGPGNISLSWTLPSGVTQIIPASQLFSPVTVTSIAGTGSALAYLNILTTGTYTVLATNSSGCSRAMNSSVTVTVTPTPNPTTITANQTICAGTSPAILTSTIGSGGSGAPYTYQWNSSITSATTGFTPIGGPSSITYQPLALTQTTYYQVMVVSNGCSATSNAVTITVAPTPTPAAAGPAQNVCNVTTATLAGNAAVVGTGTWTQTAGPASTITTPSSATTTVTGLSLAGGVYTYQWSIASGTCPPSVSTMTVTVSPTPTPAAAGPAQNVCNVTTATLAGNAAVVGTGTWTQTAGPASTITTPSSATTTVTGLSLAGGVYTYQWSIASGTCPPSVSTMTVTVSPTPTPAAAGPAQNVCNVTTATLAGNAALVGTGTWTQTAGPASTITTPSSATTTVTGLSLAGGVYTYQWSIASGTCPPSVSTMTVTVSPSPTPAAAGPAQNVCNVTTATLAGNAALVGTGTWTQTAGPASTITTPSSATTTVTGLSLAGGVYTYQWSIASGTCPPSVSTMTVTVSPSPTPAAAGPAQNVCNVTTATLAGNAAVVGTGTWTQTAGPASTITTPSSATTTVTGLSLAGGVYTYQWSIASGTCPPSVSTMTVTVSPSPTTAAAGPAQNVCNVTTATLAGNAAVVGTGTWTQTAGPASTITTPSSATTTVTGLSLAGGVYTYQWSIASGTCPPSVSTMTVTVSPSPTPAAAGPAQNVCNVTTATLAGNAAVVGTGTWTQTAGPASTITTPSSATTTVTGLSLAGGVYTYQWSIASGTCPPSVSTMTVTVSPTPTPAAAGPAQNVCNVTTATLAGNAAVVGTGTWTQTAGPASTITTPSSATTTVTGLSLAGGVYTYQWSIASGTCPPSVSTMTVTVSPTPTPAAAGPAQNVCNVTTATLAGNAAVVGTGTWTQTAGPASTITTPSSATTTVTSLSLAGGVYTYQWSIASGTCPPSVSTMTVTVSPTPTPAAAGPAQNVCNVTTATLAGNAALVGTGTWTQTAGPASTITTPSSATTTVTGLSLAGGVYTYQWSIASGTCPPSVSTMTVTVSPTPTPAAAGPAQNVCNVTTATLAGNAAVVGTGTWTQTAGPASTITTPSSATTTVTGLSLAGGVYTYQWSIASGTCPPSVSTMTVTVSPTPTPAAAGPAQNVCNVTTATLAGNAAVVGTGTWTQTAGPASTITTPSSATTTVTGLSLAGGVYTYQWSIASGTCPPSVSTMTVTVSPSPTTAAAGSNQTLCNSPTTATLAGNNPLIGAGLWSQVSGPNTAGIANTSQSNTALSGLVPGTYSFQWAITSGSCPPSISTVSITVDNLSLSQTQVNILCYGNATGAITATGLNGTGTYQYSLNGGPLQSSGSFTGLVAGSYTLLTKDAGGCTQTATVVITQPVAPLTASITSQQNVKCFSNSTGSATVTASGGTAPYTYSWNTVPAQTSDTAKGLVAGTYTVTVTDGGPCTTTATVIITQPTMALSASITSQQNVLCKGSSTGGVTVTAAGGTGPTYNYTLNYVSNATPAVTNTSGVFAGLPAGSYLVSVSDGGSCVASQAVTITEPVQALGAVITAHTDNKCKGDANGSATATVTGGTGTYTYVWATTPVQTTATATGLLAGTYVLTVTDGVGCQTYQSAIIGEPALGLQATITGTNVKCSGDANGTATVTASGGTASYTYSWSTTPALTTASVSGLTPGSYTVTITDFGGCTTTKSVTINTNTPPTAVSDVSSVVKDKPVNFKLLLTPGTVTIDLASVDLDIATPGTQSAFTIPGQGSFTVDNTGILSFTPVLKFSGFVTIKYQVSDINGCKSDTATVSIDVKGQPPVAVDDTTSAFPNSRIQIPVLANDSDPQNSVLTPVLLTQPGFGTASVLPSGMIQYTSIPDYVGTVTFTYQAKNSLTPALSSNTATVTIVIGKNPNSETVVIPTAFTPNGDGQNDVFIIKNLNLFPNNELMVFNRWGNQVYHANGYMQNGKVWDGSNLSSGTYYYILNVMINGLSKNMSGYTTIIK